MKNFGEIVFHHESELQQNITEHLTVYNCGFYSASNAAFHHKRHEKHAMLLYLHTGRATIINQNKKIEISSGNVVIFNADSLVDIYYHDDNVNERYYIFFNGNNISELMNSLSLEYLTVYKTGIFELFVNTTKQLIKNFQKYGFEDCLYKKIKIENIFALLHELVASTSVKTSTYTPIAAAIKYMKENLKEPLLSSEKYAAMCNLSKNTFIKYFKLYTKTTPRKYCNALKIENAKMQLSNTDKSVNAIAYDLNFQDPFYFTRVFTNIVGESPSSYRNKK